MRSEAIEQQQRSRWRAIFVINIKEWWPFWVGILVLKLLLLAVDPMPRLYARDSLGYIWTATTGQIPDDLSLFYGYVVRWFCNWASSFTPLVIVQVLLGVGIAIIVASICRAIFLLSNRLSYLFGFLCGIDPLQLAWERYVMPETISLFFYALVIHQSFVYLRSRRISSLVAIQILSVLTIGFRTIFLIPLQVMTVALPLIAFTFDTVPAASTSDLSRGNLRFFRQSIFWRHLVISIIALFVLDRACKQTIGFLSQREPAYTYGAGYSLLSVWAPALRPEDSPDPRLADIIRHGNEFDLKNETMRHAQRYAPGHLIDRWRDVEPEKAKSEKIAASTALSALRHNPGAVIKLAANTYYAFWRGQAMERMAQVDLGIGKISAGSEKLLRESYHWEVQPDNRAGPLTLSRWYYIAAAPYYFAILLSPLLSLALLFAVRHKAPAVLLFAHTYLIFIVTFLFSIASVTRYLQPLSLLMLLSVGLAMKSLYSSASEAPKAQREFATIRNWRDRRRQQQYCAALGIFAVAAMLRVGLAGNQPLWNDEVFSLAMATGHSLEQPAAMVNPALGDFVEPERPVAAEQLRRYIEHDNPPAGAGRVLRAVFLSDTSPPLYYLLLYGWTRIVGTSDFGVRAFSIICSLACFPFLAGIARRVGGPKAILPSCLLFAFSPLGICYSTEARMYSLLWLCVVAVTWVSLVWRDNGGGFLLAGAWVATSAAGFLTHYFFVFPWTALVGFILFRPQKIARLRLIICILFTALIVSPWYVRLPETMHNWRLTKAWLTSERDGFNRATAALHLISQNFSGAGHHESSNFIALVIFTVIAVAATWRLRLYMFARGRLLLWLLFFAPCAGVLLFDLLMHSYTVAIDRYAIAALPFACLLAAAALASLSFGTRTLLLALILLAWAPNSLIYKKTGQRGTHRNRAGEVNAKQRPTDLILIDGTPSGVLDVARYLKGPAAIAGWTPHWIAEPGTERPPERILEMAAGCTRILWVAASGAEPSPPERDWLRMHAVTVEETTFVSEFQPRDSETF